MSTPVIFKPWIGQNYSKTRTLLMSESAYDWIGDDGKLHQPEATHPEDSVKHNYAIENFGKTKYFRDVNRAICMEKHPSEEAMQAAWRDLAYTVYVQGSVGVGHKARPKSHHWKAAGAHFLHLIEELRPRPVKVIITSRTSWSRMPDCSVRLLNDLQAYKLKDDSLVWCLAVPHPSSKKKEEGFKWERVGESIKMFFATDFPAVLP
jgi:hypothetical protein